MQSKNKTGFVFKVAELKNRQKNNGVRGLEGMDGWFDHFTEDGYYEEIQEQFKEASQDLQSTAQDTLNDVVDGIGKHFFAGKASIMLEWEDLEKNCKQKLVNFILDNMLPDGEYENWQNEL